MPKHIHPIVLQHRRRRTVLQALALASLAGHVPLAGSQGLIATPPQTEGPFYPDRLPLDQDNDLVRVRGHASQAQGEVTDLSGRVLDLRGQPLRGVVVEIWQVDQHGHYIHSGDAGAQNDADFQGFGRFETGQNGEYRFRTIKPVPYPGRTPHIHFKLLKGGRPLLTTQLYVQGHPLNQGDGILRRLSAPEREMVVKPFVAGSTPGQLEVRFDIVLGRTPQA